MIRTRVSAHGVYLCSTIFACLTSCVAVQPAWAQPMVYVAELNLNRVGAYNAETGAPINANFITGGQGLSLPQGLALDSSNHLFVVNFYTAPGSPYGSVGQFNATTGATINSPFINSGQGLNNPKHTALDAYDHLFVVNSGSFNGASPVAQFNATTGATINSAFITSSQLNNQTGIAVGNDNRMYVANSYFGGDGDYISRISVFNATTGATINVALIDNGSQFEGLALDSNNRLFVAANNRISLFDAATGATINNNFIDTGVGSNAFAIALDGNNHLYVSDRTLNRVGLYDATTGATINANFITGLNAPYGLAVTTVPEPSSLFLLALAAGARVFQKRRMSLWRSATDGNDV